MPAQEQMINAIREKLIAVSLYLHKSQGQTSGNRYTENLCAAIAMEDVIVEFERLVNQIPVEQRS